MRLRFPILVVVVAAAALGVLEVSAADPTAAPSAKPASAAPAHHEPAEHPHQGPSPGAPARPPRRHRARGRPRAPRLTRRQGPSRDARQGGAVHARAGRRMVRLGLTRPGRRALGRLRGASALGPRPLAWRRRCLGRAPASSAEARASCGGTRAAAAASCSRSAGRRSWQRSSRTRSTCATRTAATSSTRRLPLPVAQRPLHASATRAPRAAGGSTCIRTRCRRAAGATGSTPPRTTAYDGFSPGNMIVTRVPGLDDPGRLRAAPGPCRSRTWPAASDPTQPVVVINARTGERQLVWSEIDSNPTDQRDVTLIIRPAKNFAEGERYIVALRNLKNAQGETIPPGPALPALPRPAARPTSRRSSGAAPTSRASSTRSAEAGIERDDLYLAWDFTVASERGLSERVLHMRDDAFAQLGDTNLADLTVQGSVADVRPGARSTTRTRLPVAFAPIVNELPIDPFEITDGRTRPRALLRRATRPSARTARATPPRGSSRGRSPCPATSTRRAARPARASPSARTACPTRLPGNTALANVMCTIPRVALSAGAGPSRCRSTATACSAARPRSGRATCRPWATSTASCSAPPTGPACRSTTCRTCSRILQDLSQLPDARRPRSAGVRELPLPRALDDPPGRACGRSRLRRHARRTTPAASSTTATARAGSWAARWPRWRWTTSARCSACRA